MAKRVRITAADLNDAGEVKIAFMGTRQGMTNAQRKSLRLTLTKWKGWFHHCDYVGSDEQAHEMITRLFPGQYRIFIHPPEDESKRANCDNPPGWTFIPHPPLMQSELLIGNTTRLIIAPLEGIESKEGQTWRTLRLARSKQRPLRIIWPDGTVSDEDW